MKRKEKLKAVIYNVVKELPFGVTRTKLVKLLYLIDLSSAKTKGTSLTGVTYRSYYYGPYSEEIIEALNELKDYEIDEYASITKDGREYYLYRPGLTPRWKNPPKLPADEDKIIDRIVKKHGNKSLDEILNYVYSTPAYKKCARGEQISF